MNALQILKQTKALIATPASWCVFVPAIDDIGYPVQASDPTACKWCLLGAKAKVQGGPNDLRPEAIRARRALEDAMRALFPDKPAFLGSILNDELGFAAVHRVLDKAIAELEASA